MSGKYDKIIKELLKDTVAALLLKTTGLDITASALLDTKFQATDEREADFVLKVWLRDGSVVIVHIEFQTTNDENMPLRMLRYWIHIKERYKLPIEQFVYYIGKEPLKMADRIVEGNTAHHYRIIDMKTVDCETFMKSDKPEEIIISILCDYKDKDVKIFIGDILKEIKNRVKEELKRSKYIKQLEILSQLRDLQDGVVKEVENMAFVFDIEKDPRFKQGVKQGLLEGIELALEIKFGRDAFDKMDKIRTIEDVAQLENLKTTIKNAKTIADINDAIERE
ncbi:Transposase (putative), YhgA-like protein [Candidatus Magnetoovum chiemensis]|nr:Transposase (putative), YhgA-like protein [Candidatus Magnetoovum chiemensis]